MYEIKIKHHETTNEDGKELMNVELEISLDATTYKEFLVGEYMKHKVIKMAKPSTRTIYRFYKANKIKLLQDYSEMLMGALSNKQEVEDDK